MIKVLQKCFIESIPFEKVNPDEIRPNKQIYKNIDYTESKPTRFQTYIEREVAYGYTKHLFKTQYSEILVEYEKVFDMKTGKMNFDRTSHLYQNRKDEKSYILVTFYESPGNAGGKLCPEDKDSTRLQELSLKNNIYFGAIRNKIFLHTKLDFTISRFFPKMSLAGLETLHHLREFARTQILQSLAQAVLKTHYAGYLLSGIKSYFIYYERTIHWYYTCTKKSHYYMFLKIKEVTKDSLSFIRLSKFCRYPVKTHIFLG